MIFILPFLLCSDNLPPLFTHEIKSLHAINLTQINQQEQMQQQLIQSTIGMSLKDPEVMKNLLAMLKEQLPKPSIVSSKPDSVFSLYSVSLSVSG